ncbi:Platelet-activating factor acetylhydrolase, plasma/intracellular isoform II [Cooperia oncophora]
MLHFQEISVIILLVGLTSLLPILYLLNKRVSECVKALHVLEEITLGQLQAENIAVGKEFDWSMFKGALDLTRAFVAGHSFGGATAIAATAFSTDFQAAAVLDGWLYPLEPGHYERATQPTLLLNAGRWQFMENIEQMRKLRNIAEKPIYTFRDAEHATFTDFPFLVNSYIGRRMKLHGETAKSLRSIIETIRTYFVEELAAMDAEHATFTDFPFLVNSYIGRRMKLHGETAPEVAMEAIVKMTVAFFNKEQGQESNDLCHLVNEKYSHFVVEGFPSHLLNGKSG